MSASLSSRALGQPGLLLLRPSVSAHLASSRPSSLASFSSSPVILSTHLRTSVASLYLSSSSAPSLAVRQLRLARDPLAFSSPAASLRSLSTSPRRVDSPRSESKDGSTRFTRPEEDHDEDEPRNPSISQKFKALSRKYGWWAFGVYNALSLIDFSIAFAGVQYLGAERVVAVEAAVVGWVYDRLGWERREPLSEEGEGKKTGEVSIYTKVALAYGVHKTLFLPIRLTLTASLLPKFVAWMTRLGWAGKGAKGVQAKVKQVVEKTKEAAKRS